MTSAAGNGLPTRVTTPAMGTSGGPVGAELQPMISIVRAMILDARPGEEVQFMRLLRQGQRRTVGHGRQAVSNDEIRVLRDKTDAAVAEGDLTARGMEAAGPAPTSDLANAGCHRRVIDP